MKKQAFASVRFLSRIAKPYLHSNATPYIVLFCISLFMHVSLTTHIGDDLFFSTVLDSSLPKWMALKDFLAWRWETWSSRLLIEGVLVLLAPYPNVWYIFDSLIMTLIPLSLNILLNTNKNITTSWFLCGIMLLLPQRGIIHSAGWIATSLNYTWPLAFGLFMLIPAQKILSREHVSPIENILSVLALMYAGNHEQMCLILLAILGALFLYLLLYRKQFSLFIASELFLLFLNLLLILLCPGNAQRFSSEVTTWFPSFTQLSLFSKIELGFSSTGFLLMMQTNWVYLSFCFILFVLVSSYKKDSFSHCIAFIPLFAGMIWGPLAKDLKNYFPRIISYRDAMMQQGTIDRITFKAFIPDLILIFVFCCILYSLFICSKDRQKTSFMLYLLLVSLASRFMMGFSPTVWASGERTSLFMYFGFIAISTMMIQEIDTILDKEHILRRLSKLSLIVFYVFFTFERML